MTTYGYDAAMNLTGYAYPNTVNTANVFDTLNRLTQTCEAITSPACSAGTKLASYAYTLGNAGNRTNVLELNSRNVVYGYYNDYRLSSETITADPGGNNGSETYTYDVVGNRFSLTSTIPSLPGSINYFYDANDRLTTDTYDNNGSTTASLGTSNIYDFENRMLTHGGVTLVYDGDGNRVSETVGGSTTKYLVDDHNPTDLPQVLDELVNGSVTKTYAYGLQRISEDQLISNTWTPSFYGYDGHGNVRFLTNTSGATTDSYDYDAFGMPIRTSGSTGNSFLYSGERSDSSIGLYDLRARYYNQATGRFWARDALEGYPCLPATLHPYVYAANEPVDRIDPLGFATIAPPAPIAQPAPAPTPTQPNRQASGATLEYLTLVAVVSFSAFEGLQYLTQEINCGYTLKGSQTAAIAATSAPAAQVAPCLAKPKPKTCADSFPNAIPCAALPPDYKYNDAAQAIGAIWGYWGRPVGTKNEAAAEKGPCSVNGAGPLAGTHYSLKFLDGSKKPYAGSVGCCPCCDDSDGQPRLIQRCACLNVDHKPCPF